MQNIKDCATYHRCLLRDKVYEKTKNKKTNSYSTLILSQTLFCFYVFFILVFGFVVVPQNCYRPDHHKIDLTIAENPGLGDVLAKIIVKHNVSTLNCYRPGPHKIDLKIAENPCFGDVLVKNQCKTQCL